MAAEAEALTHARDYAGIALAYAREAAADRAGKRHCRWVRLAAKRHLEDLKRARKKGCGYYFDAWHGDDVCDFIEKLPHVEGEWETDTIWLEPVQIFILVVVFGWRRRVDGRRRFTSVYIEMARKGAKSTLTAGVTLYCLTCEGEAGPQIIVGATTGDQAKKVFEPARKMVQRTPSLRDAFGVKAWARSITCDDNQGYIQTINAKSSTQDGWNPYVGVLDELHAHRDRGLYDVIRSAFGSRKSPLLWIITTAGYNIAGVCYEQRLFVTKVLLGIVQADHYFGIIFTLDTVDDYEGRRKTGDDPFDEKVWIKANPMLGVTPTIEGMRSYAAEAQASPASAGEFQTKRLNVWLNAASTWLNMERWKAAADPTLDWSDFEGLECWIGLDLADKDDITAAVLAAFDEDDRLLFKPVFWLPEAVLEDPQHAEGGQGAPYRTWNKEGHLRLTPGDWIDHDLIERQIREWIERFSVRGVRGDQFAAFQSMAARLNEDFVMDPPLAAVLHKSAPNITDPAKDLEARVKSGAKRLRHDGNPIMTWMASNTVVSRRVDGSILPKKETSMSPNKIDGIDAAINAIAPAVHGMAQEPQSSVYEERGLLAL
ncbi:MAG: terminase large subunit [Thalassobaculum sp.]